MNKVLEIQDLKISYGIYQALNTINLSITIGKVVGIISASGLVNLYSLKL